MLATMAMKFGKVYSERVLSNNEIFKGLSLQQVEIIFEDHLKDVFEFYFTIRKESRMDSFDVVSNVFGIAFKSIDRFDNKLIKELDTLKEKEYNQIMADLMAYAFCQKDSLSTSLKTFIKKYIDSLSKLKYKKLFKKVQEILDDKTLARVNPFIDDYLEKHKGFLEKLFEKKERKDKK